MPKNIDDGPSIAFPKGTVFVRKTSTEECNRHCKGSTQTFHTVLDVEGGLLAIVCGGPQYAFATAKKKNAQPVWMQ